MNIQVDKEIVEQAVAQAIVDSAIGQKIKEAVDTMLKQSYQNPIDEAIKKVVTETAVKAIAQGKFQDQIREAVEKKLTGEKIDGFVSELWDRVLRR